VLPNKKAERLTFDLLKQFARAHLRADSKVRAMILDEQGDVSRQEMIVKLDVYNRLLGKENV
jgi:hypothetical protein